MPGSSVSGGAVGSGFVSTGGIVLSSGRVTRLLISVRKLSISDLSGIVGFVCHHLVVSVLISVVSSEVSSVLSPAGSFVDSPAVEAELFSVAFLSSPFVVSSSFLSLPGT